jgi:hypothetical protein
MRKPLWGSKEDLGGIIADLQIWCVRGKNCGRRAVGNVREVAQVCNSFSRLNDLEGLVAAAGTEVVSTGVPEQSVVPSCLLVVLRSVGHDGIF